MLTCGGRTQTGHRCDHSTTHFLQEVAWLREAHQLLLLSSWGMSLIFQQPKTENMSRNSTLFPPLFLGGAIKFRDWWKLFPGLLLVPICISPFYLGWKTCFSLCTSKAKRLMLRIWWNIYLWCLWKTVPLDSATFSRLVWIFQFISSSTCWLFFFFFLDVKDI